MQACDRCRRRKSGCDKEQPSCRVCKKAGVVCLYSDRTKDSPIRRDVIEGLERRLRQTEATNKALAARLASSKSPPGHENPSSTIRSPQSGETRNEVSDEVSFLTLNAGGERQFLGSTSGVLFADLIRSAIRDETTSGPPLSAPGLGPATVSTFSTQASQRPAPTKTATLPVPESIARDVHNSYFQHDHLCYPILSRHSAMASIRDIYANPTKLERNPYEAFCFYMVMAISTSNIHTLHWQSVSQAENYHTQAMHRLSDVLALGGAKALQAILLLCQCQLKSSTQTNSASLWHMVGIAARMCFEMGLHREDANRYRNPTTLRSSSMDHRRWLWCVLAMDRVVSITLGRPFAIQLEDVDLNLTNYEITQPSSASGIDDAFPTERHQDAVFAHITKYRVLCGRIVSSLHRGRRIYNENSGFAAQASLANDLKEWHSNTSTLFLGEDSPGGSMLSSFLTPEWYEMIYHNALLMLYRPSPALPLNSSTAAMALAIVYDSAKQAIGFYAQLHELHRINYTWITLRSVFMAGLSFVYAAGQHFRSKKSQRQVTTAPILDSDPSIVEIVNVCRSCSNVLVAVSERGNIPRYSHRVFDRLSDAVLKDAVEHHTPTGVNNHPSSPLVPIPPGTLYNSDPSNIAPSEYGMDMLRCGGWNYNDTVPSSVLAVDDVFRDCFDDLQHFHESAFGEDPIGQLSQDWLEQIGGVQLPERQTYAGA